MRRAGLGCVVRNKALEVADEIDAGAGALIMTDAALSAAGIETILASLARQPAWSDLPIVLLCQPGPQTPLVSHSLSQLTNVTVLDRPTSARTLVSTVEAALRGRLRQYQTRDQLEALRVAEENLRNADRRKDEFLAMLAHELRNPLAPIRNAGELLVRTLPANPEVRTIAGIVQRQSTHLSRLVDDLLDVSRITQGRIELQQELVDVSSVLSEALESVEPLMREKQHKVFVAAGHGPVYVRGDHARLVQCVANILNNSAKYTDPGGEIRLEVRSDARHVSITISDNGVGIPAQLLPRIFDLFVQGNRSLDRSQGGLGIGLSLVHRLIEMHDGTVSATSEGPGLGARFEVTLPVMAAPREMSKEHSHQPPARRRILVVDDNADSANSLALILNISGHVAQPVYGPAEALERAAVFDPEVVLLDIGLPGMDGYEVARQLRIRGSHARLVAVTGYGQPGDQQRAQEAGFDAHLVKPVDVQHLLRDLDGIRVGT